jgi:hypothetical protein
VTRTVWAAAAVLLSSAITTAAAQTVDVLVVVSRYQFSPGGPVGPPIDLHAGVTHRITFRSIDVEHGVSAIPALGIPELFLTPGSEAIVMVSPTVDQVGRYNFACTQVCGFGHGGMFGAIEVVGVEEADILRLLAGRFTVAVTYRAPDGNAGSGHPVALTDDSGYFWFFDSGNVEIVVKVLDGCGVDGRFWVFASGLTDVEAVLSVTDATTGEHRDYTNPGGRAFSSVQDTAAFATCP